MAKILIADDDPKMQSVLARYFEPEHETFAAKDGEEALAMARSLRPDLVLLDIYMPKHDGIGVLRALAPEMPGTGFLMITGNGDEEVARECLKCGACDYITKPIDFDTLRDAVEARLRAQK